VSGRTLALILLALAGALAAERAATGEEPAGDTAADLAAARAVFEANLDAIRNKDRDAYLDCYLQSENLARSGPTGPVLGYAGLEESAGSGWPEVFQGHDLRLIPIRPGVVYGTYRYRVRFDGVEQTGISERVFVATPEGWKIAVTTAFGAPPGVPPPPVALVGAWSMPTFTFRRPAGPTAGPTSWTCATGGPTPR
jgi:hypothetical protein